MAKDVSTESSKIPERLRPGLVPSTDEMQCISMAMDIAKERLANGTASNSMVLHFLKMATPREQLEREDMKKELELKEAKIRALESQVSMEEKLTEAMAAFQRYSGYDGGETVAPPF